MLQIWRVFVATASLLARGGGYALDTKAVLEGYRRQLKGEHSWHKREMSLASMA